MRRLDLDAYSSPPTIDDTSSSSSDRSVSDPLFVESDDMEEDLAQHNEFWDHELEVRKRSGCLTAKEQADLASCDTSGRWDEVTKKYGKPEGFDIMLEMLEDLMMDEHDFHPGELVNFASKPFSLLKGLLIATRARNRETIPIIGCFCLEETAFQPMGCACHSMDDDALLPAYAWSPCEQCSKCVRCQGLLGANQVVLRWGVQAVSVGFAT